MFSVLKTDNLIAPQGLLVTV